LKAWPLVTAVAPQAAQTQLYLEKLVWNDAETIPPGEARSRLVVFEPLPDKPRLKRLSFECSWLTLGQETFHVRFPFDTKPPKKKK